MVDDTKLDPMDARFAPLAQAIGRAVLGAAALEKVLLVDIANRKAAREGFREELGSDLEHLERRSAGILLEKLRELGLSADVAQRVEAAVARRNRLVHHFMEEPEVLIALTTEQGTDQLVPQVDSLAIECQQLINVIAPDSFSGLLRMLGMNISQLLDFVQSVDLDSVDDQKLRDHFALLRGLDLEQLKRLFTDASPD